MCSDVSRDCTAMCGGVGERWRNTHIDHTHDKLWSSRPRQTIDRQICDELAVRSAEAVRCRRACLPWCRLRWRGAPRPSPTRAGHAFVGGMIGLKPLDELVIVGASCSSCWFCRRACGTVARPVHQRPEMQSPRPKQKCGEPEEWRVATGRRCADREHHACAVRTISLPYVLKVRRSEESATEASTTFHPHMGERRFGRDEPDPGAAWR